MASVSKVDLEIKKLEYSAAQEMIRHYDSLNWQIGSILIAATIVLTGLVLRQEVIRIIQSNLTLSWLLVFGIPFFSLFILIAWLLWFRRHRDLYNFRNETLHRLEIELGLFHYLRVIEGDFSEEPESKAYQTIAAAKSNAGHAENSFTPFYSIYLSKPSGYTIAKIISFGIPTFQLALFIAIKYG